MKRNLKTMLGVTLLEIMLVLAIAAMVIVMSIRYYKAATVSQQSNAVLEQLQAITAGMDSLAQAQGTYANISTSAITAVVGGVLNMTTPWNTVIVISGQTATTYNVKVPSTPAGVCQSLLAKFNTTANSKVTTSSCASTTGAGDFTYTYDSTQ